MLDLIRTRRSIRLFEDRPLSSAELLALQEAALRAPTARNARASEFVFVTEREVLQALATSKPGGAFFLGEVVLGVVVCVDETQTDCWVEDASIAATYLQLQAHAMGLGSTWCHIRNRNHDENTTAEAYIQRLLGIPSSQRIVCIIGIGHPAEHKDGWPADTLSAGKIHRERFMS